MKISFDTAAAPLDQADAARQGAAAARAVMGWWTGDAGDVDTNEKAIAQVVHQLGEPVLLVESQGRLAVAHGGGATLGGAAPPDDAAALPLLGFAPALDLRRLGDPAFCDDHRIHFPYMTGAMANGIASVELVEAIAKAGMLGCYGAAGQRIDVIRSAIDRLQSSLGDLPFAFNLIHSPNEPAHEMNVVELYLKRGVTLVEASAYLDLTLPAVRYRITGVHRDAQGRIVTPHRIIAKVSRIEVATKWFSPPPPRMVDELVKLGHLTRQEADLARFVPMAQDLTVEADSGGHTDNRPLVTLLPTMLALRDRLQREHDYAAHGFTGKLRVGAAGGIATPAAAAAAFAMGAAYIVTGSINQACIESGSSDIVRRMLAEAQQSDTIMAPAADMFEMGVKLQVLKRGTMFAMRAQKLYDLYRAHNSIDELPATERRSIEKTIFRATLDEIWVKTKDYFNQYDPAQVLKADRDGKHKMALIFRWYLGLSSRWANSGEPSRQIDYQVWCGPSMGAFNEWTKGTPLERPENRKAAAVAMALLHGAGVITRLNALRGQGVSIGTVSAGAGLE